MKTLILLLALGVSTQSHALVMNGKDACWDAMFCTAMTTTSLPVMIVEDANGDEVWNSSDEQLLAQYKAELNGSAEIYQIKRYADVKTGGDIELAKVEICKNLEALAHRK